MRSSASPLCVVLGAISVCVAACHQEVSTVPPVAGKHDVSWSIEQEPDALRELRTAGNGSIFQQIDPQYGDYQSRFSFYAAAGAADAEAPEFKKLNDEYGIPGNPCTTYEPGTVGVWVYYPLKQTEGLLQLRLSKDLATQEISFHALYCVKNNHGLPDPGNPKISMKIPLTELDGIVASGVKPSILDRFDRAVLESQWTPGWRQPHLAPPPITLEYD